MFDSFLIFEFCFVQLRRRISKPQPQPPLSTPPGPLPEGGHHLQSDRDSLAEDVEGPLVDGGEALWQEALEVVGPSEVSFRSSREARQLPLRSLPRKPVMRVRRMRRIISDSEGASDAVSQAVKPSFTCIYLHFSFR